MILEGRVAIVTGGVSGIGKALCESLLKRGSKVVIADINDTVGNDTALELSRKYNKHDDVIFLKCDVTDKQGIYNVFKETVDKFGQVDILFNNAGMVDEIKWERMIDLNFTAVIHGTDVALDFMGKHNGGKGGVVVNTASASGRYMSHILPVYSGTKAAVVMFTACAGAPTNYERHGVRINAFCPSLVDTGLVNDMKSTVCTPAVVDEWEKEIMRAEDVAEAAMELVTDDDKCGALLEIDRGIISYFTIPE